MQIPTAPFTCINVSIPIVRFSDNWRHYRLYEGLIDFND